MEENSARYKLPFIIPGQAQKELFHNEALALVDVALHPAVQGPPIATPPPAPAVGQCWLVGTGASGAWSGKAGLLAAWTEGGWRFVEPQIGMAVWDESGSFVRRWTGQTWTNGELVAASFHVAGVQVVGPRQPATTAPTGGAVIDAEARAAIGSIVVALKSHGLIE